MYVVYNTHGSSYCRILPLHAPEPIIADIIKSGTKGGVDLNETQNQLKMVKLGLMIGVMTGLLSVTFNYSVKYLIKVMMLYSPIPFETRMLVIPIVGGLALGLIHKYFIRGDLYGFDVAGVMEEIRAINSYLMRPVLVIAKTLATIITLAIGWSAGRHGPIVYIGGSVGSWIGYTYKFSRENIKILIASGVAGSLAGVFNEPIFAILFVLEVILHKDYLKYFTPVTAAAVASAAVTHLVNGGTPFIALTGSYSFGTDVELAFMVLLGVAMGLLAVVYIRAIKFSKLFFARIQSPIVKGLLGGVIIAGMGYYLPDLFDIHLGTTARIVSGQLGWKLVLMLVMGKFIVTGVTLGAGGVGGVFLPGLYIGAAAGYLFGLVLELIPAVSIASPGTYALVGMAAIFAGFGNAPLSATLLAVELTGAEGLILPFLITTVVASIITEAIQKDSIYGHSNFIWAEEEKALLKPESEDGNTKSNETDTINHKDS